MCSGSLSTARVYALLLRPLAVLRCSQNYQRATRSSTSGFKVAHHQLPHSSKTRLEWAIRHLSERGIAHTWFIHLNSRLLTCLRRPVGCFDTELLGVLRVQSLPAELHRRTTNDAADRSSAEKVIQNIETNVPPGGTHRDEAAIDVMPQRQPRAVAQGLEFPPDILGAPVVLKKSWEWSARVTVVSETCALGAATVVSFTVVPTVARLPSASKGAHSLRCAGSVSACQTFSGAWRSSRTRMSVHFSSLLLPLCPRSFCTRAPLAGPGVYNARSVIFFSLADRSKILAPRAAPKGAFIDRGSTVCLKAYPDTKRRYETHLHCGLSA